MKKKTLKYGGPPRKPSRGEAAAAVNTRRRRKRTGRQTLNYLVILLVAAAIMIVLSMTVLFPIEKIEVTGVTKYAPEQIIEAAGVKVGDNLFRVGSRGVEKKLVNNEYAYIQSVTLKRNLPGTLVLDIVQEEPLGAVNTDAGYIIVGKSGRILETGARTVPANITVVTGMYLYKPEVGQVMGEGYAKAESEQAEQELDSFKRLQYLVDAIDQTGFRKITMVDFTDALNIMVVYDDRIIVELGSELELPYKLQMVDRIITEELDASYEGTIDAASAMEAKQAYVHPCDVQAQLQERGLIKGPEPVQQAPAGQEKPETEQAPPDPQETQDPQATPAPARGPYTAEDLATKPGPDQTPEPSKAPEPSKESGSQSGVSSGEESSSDPADAPPEADGSGSEGTASSKKSIYSDEDLAVVD